MPVYGGFHIHLIGHVDQGEVTLVEFQDRSRNTPIDGHCIGSDPTEGQFVLFQYKIVFPNGSTFLFSVLTICPHLPKNMGRQGS